MYYHKLQKTHLEWIIQDITLTFIHENPYLDLNTTEIKQNLKHIEYKKYITKFRSWFDKINQNVMQICQNDMMENKF